MPQLAYSNNAAAQRSNSQYSNTQYSNSGYAGGKRFNNAGTYGNNNASSYSSNNAAERIMPQNLDAEKAVLSAMMFGSEVGAEVSEEILSKLKPEDFYRPAHQKIFAVMQDLVFHNIPIDQISVTDRLEACKELDAVGGRAYIIELGNNAYALSHWEHHVEIVKREHMLRELIGAAARIQAIGYDAPDDLDEVVEESEKLLFDVTNQRVTTGFQPAEALVMQAFGELQELANSGGRTMGIRTGFNALDDLLGGLRGGDLVILAARPSIGKTALALNIASRASQLGTSVAFFSLEMSASQLIQRVLAIETKIDSKKIQTGQGLTAKDWNNLIKTSNTISSLDLWIDDTPSASILEVRAKARRQLRNVEPEKGLVIVDYLQLMQPQNTRTESRQVEIAEISRGLKILAKELNMPIIALSQLSRAVEGRKDKRPILSDLRESGAIEQDADVVMFLDRSKTLNESQDEERPDWGVGDVIVAKHRNGPIGLVHLAFQEQFTRFDNMAYPDDRIPEEEY